MRNLERLSVLTAVVLGALALTAATASADIENSSGVYTGPFEAVHPGPTQNTDPDPSFGGTISCQGASISGTMDGDWDASGPANGVLDFAWEDCTAMVGGVQSCTIDPVTDVPVNLVESSTALAPDWQIVNTDRLETFIDCAGGVFSCDVWSDPGDGTGFVADVDSERQVIEINDEGSVGGIGCPTSGGYDARYEITTPEDDLFSTGTQ
jgi:hypothetical protein